MQADRARVYLYVPAHDERKLAKALGEATADALILDLEDGVPAAERATARARLAALPEKPPLPVLVRINSVGTPDHDLDLDAVAAAPGLAGVVLAKAEAGQLEAIEGRLPAGRQLWPLIESAAGLASLAVLPGDGRLGGLLLGAGDLLADLGGRWTEDEVPLLYARSLLVATAARLRVAAVDTPDAEFHDLERVAIRASRARDLGFTAKAAIHPAQVGPIRAAFMPTPEEIAWAREVVANAARGGAWTTGTEIQDAATVRRAERLLEGVE